MESGPTIEAMREVVRALESGDSRDKILTIQRAQDALDAQKSAALTDLQVSRDFELDGASTLSMWARNSLRLTSRQVADLVRAHATLTYLPEVAEAAASGQIRTQHVAVFTYGLKHIGADTMARSEPWLLNVAKTCDPLELHRVVRALRDAVFPDELDKAWADGMDKQDIQVVPVPGGWHVTGFLNVTAGAKFQKVLDAVSAPHDADDTRSGSERRVQGLDDLMTKVLEGGLPSDKGIRPHMSVMVDAETLQAAVEPASTASSDRPARLAGYGSVGPNLLTYLACISDFTPILTQKPGEFTQARILNVGRSHRAPTLKQRRAVLARQGGVCATPGCNHTHLEIHHVIWVSHGGPTDVDLLIGLCVRCHHLLHRGLLNIRGNAHDGFQFTNKDNRSLLRAHRERQANWREECEIHKVAVGMSRRREARLRM